MNRTCIFALTLVLASLLDTLSSRESLASSGQSRERFIDLSKNSVVMVYSTFIDSSDPSHSEIQLGAGLLFGRRSNRLYIATAEHVVRRGARAATVIEVEFRAVPGQRHVCELIERRFEPLDLAVLTIEPNKYNIVVKDSTFKNQGESRRLKRGDGVHQVGHAHDTWSTNLQPDLVDRVSGSDVYFQSKFVSTGQSGGGLFNTNWELVGMIVADQPPNGRAIPIEAIQDAVRSGNLPWDLTPSGRTKGSHTAIWIVAGAGAGGAVAYTQIKKDSDQTNGDVDVDLRLNNQKSGNFSCSRGGGLVFTVTVANRRSEPLTVNGLNVFLRSQSGQCSDFDAGIDPVVNSTIQADNLMEIRRFDLGGALCGQTQNCNWRAEAMVSTSIGTFQDSIQFSTTS